MGGRSTRRRRQPPLPEPAPGRAARAFTIEIGGREVMVLAAPTPPPGPSLTATERAVAELALEGMSNADIAARRGTSVRTVANQLATIYRKLGVGSRAELAARGLQPVSDGARRSAR